MTSHTMTDILRTTPLELVNGSIVVISTELCNSKRNAVYFLCENMVKGFLESVVMESLLKLQQRWSTYCTHNARILALPICELK